MKRCRQYFTAEYLRSILDYNSDTGVFTWRYRADYPRNWNTKHAGREAGTVFFSQIKKRVVCRTISIEYWAYRAHQLAWLYVYGCWPPKDREIDHRDTNPLNNRIGNLRLATRSLNAANSKRKSNNKSGFKGVSWAGKQGWLAKITTKGVPTKLGYCSLPEQAHALYLEEAKKRFGEFANAG